MSLSSFLRVSRASLPIRSCIPHSRVCISTSLYSLVRRSFSTKTKTSTTTPGDASLSSVRNLGIIAHIDAGKTTTTERMLFYSGKTTYIGDVDQGNTTMDYLQEERERGITIQSACIAFQWKDHTFNLIDTPGHVDFTVEVERAVRVLDGAVAIVDAVAGVQAQTETVWKQADRYGVPRIVFVNKLDRDGASLDRAVKSIEKRFGVLPLVTQYPVNVSRNLNHIIDLIQMKHFKWEGESGSDVSSKKVTEKCKEFSEVESARLKLLEGIADLDDTFADIFLSEEDPLLISPSEIQAALRRITLALKGVPVLCGASLRNIGVQPLLDAVISYLPSPLERPPVTGTLLKDLSPISLYPRSKDPLSALAFKATYDPQSGPVVFVRVYSGTLKNREMLQCIDSENKIIRGEERSLRLLELEANNHKDITSISAGHIGAIIGMKSVSTGDTIVRAKEKKSHALPEVHIPDPVFYCSIEPMESSQYVSMIYVVI